MMLLMRDWMRLRTGRGQAGRCRGHRRKRCRNGRGPSRDIVQVQDHPVELGQLSKAGSLP